MTVKWSYRKLKCMKKKKCCVKKLLHQLWTQLEEYTRNKERCLTLLYGLS